MRLLAARVLAALCALTWLVFPGFGLIDLGVTWNPAWPVVLEAGWGVFMALLVGGAFLAIAIRPTRAAPAAVTLLVPDRERLRPVVRATSLPLLAVAIVGAVPWLVHAARMYRLNRGGAGEAIGELTLGVDHHAVQGALALALLALALLAAVWPRGRRALGSAAGIGAAYTGLVSFAFPDAWAGFSPAWSVLCMVWGAAVAALALAAPGPSEPRELGGEVVETERAL